MQKNRTNKIIQYEMNRKLDAYEAGEIDFANVKIFFSSLTRLMKSHRDDVEISKMKGTALMARTEEFFKE